MNWKSIISGVIIGVILGMATTFFVLQKRITSLEADLKHKKHSSQPSITNNLKAQIERPRNNDFIDQFVIVTGKASTNLQGKHLWLVVHPVESNGWWPQLGEIFINPSDGKWSIRATLGSPKDIKKVFEIAIVIANRDAHESFNNYLKSGEEKNSYPAQPLPSGIEIVDKIILTRK